MCLNLPSLNLVANLEEIRLPKMLCVWHTVYLLLNMLESTQQIILYGAPLHRDNLVHPSSIPMYKVPQFVCLKYRGFLSHMVTPSSHPFEIGIFHYKSTIFVETPILILNGASLEHVHPQRVTPKSANPSERGDTRLNIDMS